MQRVPTPAARNRMVRNVMLTNVAVVVFVGALCFAFGWQTVLFVELPLVVLAGSIGIWLFYVQHQFDDTYWERTDEWSFNDAAAARQLTPGAAEGAAVLQRQHRLPPRAPPQPKIPNYNLQRAHEEQPMFRSVPA